MFSLKDVNGKIDVYHDSNLLIKGISPVVNLNDGQTRPELNTRDKGMFKYTDEQRGLTLNLSFNMKDDLIWMTVEAFVEKGSFSPVGGVTLEVEGVSDVKNSMALYLFKDWWTRPFFTKDFGELPDRTQALTWTDGDFHYSILTVCSGNCKTDLKGAGDKLDLKVSTYDTGHNNYKTLSFILGACKNPYELQQYMVSTVFDKLRIQGKPRECREYPQILKYFGWCSWDAFYQKVNEKGIIDKAEEFKKAGFPVRWFIVDDGWSDVKDNMLMFFDEDKDKFPHGFDWLINKLKKEYGISWTGVWQAFEGYWQGINPDSPLSKEYSQNIYKTKGGKLIPYPDKEKAFGFWNAWHSSLREKGIDFVKVDNQGSYVNFIRDNMDICNSTANTHAALEASVGLNFNGTIINCMGMASENIWNRPYTAVSRNSDDFFPRVENSFREHALQNAYNSYITGNIIWGDWDMFWTKHPQNINNAVLRALSGGPVYVSDEVGNTDVSVLWPLVFSDGEVLRCDRPGMPTADCLYNNPQEEEVPLKVWNRVGAHGLIGAFNINTDGKSVKGVIRPSDVDGIEGEKFVIYEHFSKKVYVVDKEQGIDITLPENAVQLYIISPVKNGFAVIGDVDKYISPRVIEKIAFAANEINIAVREGGNFGFVSLKKPEKVCINGKEASIKENGDNLYTVDCGRDIYSQINMYI